VKFLVTKRLKMTGSGSSSAVFVMQKFKKVVRGLASAVLVPQ